MKARLLVWSALLLCLLVVLSGCAVTSVPAPAAAEEVSEDVSDEGMDDACPCGPMWTRRARP